MFFSMFPQAMFFPLPESKFQYLLTACEPYETIAFKASSLAAHDSARMHDSSLAQVPNMEIDKAENKFFTSWDPQRKVFTMQAPNGAAK